MIIALFSTENSRHRFLPMLRRLVVLCLFLGLTTVSPALEILEAVPDFSGRCSGFTNTDAEFGRPQWYDRGLYHFKRYDYLLGNVSYDRRVKVAPVFAFRISPAFAEEMVKGNTVRFLFNVAELHEGDAENILPIKIFLLKTNARSALAAAEAQPVQLLGTINPGELRLHRIYSFTLPKPARFQTGDIAWIGLNARNPLVNTNNSIVIGGDLNTLPGAVGPMLVTGDEKSLFATVQGISFMDIIEHQANAPASPGDLNSSQTNPVPDSFSALASRAKIKQLETIRLLLARELDKLPPPQRHLLESHLGFHSSFKSLDENWRIRLPINGIASAICLVPALRLNGDSLVPFAFPKRFIISAHLMGNPKPQVIADWSKADFPMRGSSPVLFSFPWHHYDRIELNILRGETNSGSQFFALEELLVHRPAFAEQSVVQIAPQDSLEDEPLWSRRYLTDGVTSLGLTRTGKSVARADRYYPFADGLVRPLEILLTLPEEQRIWDLDFYPANDAQHPELAFTGFPRRMTVELSSRSDFSNATVMEFRQPVTPVNTPVNLTFEPVNARFIRLKITELSDTAGVPGFALAEIRANGGHSLNDASVKLSGFPPNANAADFNDDCANGFHISDPLPWIVNLIRRGIIASELDQIDRQIASLQKQRQRLILGTISGGGIVLLFSSAIVLLWQKRRNTLASRRVRREIQQDLHDEIGSSLGMISLVSDHMLRSGPPAALHEELSDINQCSREAAASLREVIWLTDKQILTLDQCLSHMANRAHQMVRDCQLEVELPPRIPPIQISNDFKRNLFLLFTESIHNCLKHARATRLDIRFQLTHSELCITLIDNGCGFDPQNTRDGVGLRSMAERARHIGGDLRIQSAPAQGTMVEFKMPLKTPDPLHEPT
jgi:signal transduction histidine kinase